MGEPAGIGPEVAAAAFHALGGAIGARALKIVGDPDVFEGLDLPASAFIATTAKAKRQPGKPSPDNAAATVEAISLAVSLCQKGEAGGLVTAPINKHVLMQTGFAYPGHTDYLQHLTGAKRAVMMLASKALRVVPMTVHVPLASVPGLVTREAIIETAEITLAALQKDFGIAAPRLAIAGLNPHAGENGALGGEEDAVIAPAISELRAHGHHVIGPLPSDTMFHEEARKAYDAALCMYHDQALIPIKTLSFWDGVNVTLGLPIVRTSPDHGTAFEIAGQGKADHRSMLAAIAMAGEMADARNQQK
ncbi:4-hydroxythreonine-4-phosphate dehydrogenase [Rhizomicrobium palustre]|uniref:4-hydroxythreonine-4-phosphate dehydrogenase n=1 Tax=Rhizomicrobium palustre TaxID=189966 RepID=A0A846MUB3_9PROT|nr:4-hydroxythreonine-4-phosphate dehydrogenase PdxA [Rhizomicrobium palustre]NIK87024.1 4-hydroxythreonine-4-phosphate dehydrogenase [Rhizomicrobium palustre]